MSELPKGIHPAEPVLPRESASGVIVGRDPDDVWKVLLGLRSRRSRFLPGFLACPGGRLEPADRPAEPGAYARCASREVEEETGVSIPAARWVACGERTTPPIFPLRFRTRFFVGEIGDGVRIPGAPASPDEIESLHFETPANFLEEWAAGRVKIPPPTLAILRAMDERELRNLDELARAIAIANGREERAPRIEFAPGVWVLPVRSATLPPASHTNVWMPGGRRFAVIDPGSNDAFEIDRLLEVVERRRAGGSDPLAVALTHHHRDHTAGAVKVARRLGLPILAHPQVLDALEGKSGLQLRPMLDGDRLDLEGCDLEVLHTPGHAPGHLVFALRGRELLIAGDLISGVSTILIDPDDGDMSTYLASLRRARELRCGLLLPGHGPPLPGKALDRLIEHRVKREQRIFDQIGGSGLDLGSIARGAYADLPEVPTALIERQTLSHLILLEQEGRVRRADPQGRRWSLR